VTPPAPAARAWQGFQHVAQLRCPHGHHMRQDTLLLADAVLRCKATAQRAAGTGAKVECGVLLYALRIPDTDLVWCAAVSIDEVRELQRRGLSQLPAVAFLGGAAPGAVIPPPRGRAAGTLEPQEPPCPTTPPPPPPPSTTSSTTTRRRTARP
jgi:hypothetical protein